MLFFVPPQWLKLLQVNIFFVSNIKLNISACDRFLTDRFWFLLGGISVIALVQAFIWGDTVTPGHPLSLFKQKWNLFRYNSFHFCCDSGSNNTIPWTWKWAISLLLPCYLQLWQCVLAVGQKFQNVRSLEVATLNIYTYLVSWLQTVRVTGYFTSAAAGILVQNKWLWWLLLPSGSESSTCTYCGELVGNDAKITIEHLNVNSHPYCFKVI